MAATVPDSETRSTRFGFTPNRVRGLIGLVLLFGLVYLTLFESNPPPVFTEVEIEIPPKPKEFDEANIVLPDFTESSVQEETDENVVISKVENRPKPAPSVEQEVVVNIEPTTPQQETESVEQPEPVEQPAPAIEETRVVVTPQTQTGFVVQVLALSNREVADEVAGLLTQRLNETAFVQEVQRGGILCIEYVSVRLVMMKAKPTKY